MSNLFDVGVSVYLANRISGDLLRIVGGFRTADAAVQAMRRSITDLEARQTLLGRRLETTNAINRDSLAILNRRYAQLLATGNLEENLAQRQALNARIKATEARMALRNEAAAVQMGRMQNDVLVRRLALQAELAATYRRRLFMAGGAAVGITAGVALSAYEIAKAGLPIGEEEARLRIAGNLSQRQVHSIAAQARQISSQLAVVNWQQELSIATALYSTLRPKLAQAMLQPLSMTADLVKLMQKGDLAPSAGQLGQLANLLGAGNSRQALNVGTAVANVLRQGGPGVNMARLADWATYVGGVLPGRTVGERASQFEQFALLSARYGGLTGAFSGENLRQLLQAMTHPANVRQIAVQAMLERYGLPKEPQERTFANIIGAIRRGETANQGGMVNVLDLMMGRSSAVAMLHQLRRLGPAQLQAIERSPQQNETIMQMWRTQMQSASAQVERLKHRMETLTQTVGSDLDPALKNLANRMNDSVVNRMQKWVDSHGKEITKVANDFVTVLGAITGFLSRTIGPTLDQALHLMADGISALSTAVQFLNHPGTTMEHLIGSAGRKDVGNMAVDFANWIIREVHHHHVHEVHISGNTGSLSNRHVVQQVTEGLRKALTAAGTSHGIPESPMLHGKTSP